MTVECLEGYGIEPMDEEEKRQFLSSQSEGVLGIPAEEAPALRPLSFWFDGDDRLYFLYVVGSSSRKAELSDEASTARFLVYRAETQFNWRSLLLTGDIERVSDEERESVRMPAEVRSRPDSLERASGSENACLYQFRIYEWTGFKHVGLPPKFE